MASTGQKLPLKGILSAHHRDIARLQRVATDRQRDLIRDAFLEVKWKIDGIPKAAASMSWTQANQVAVMAMVEDAYGKVYKHGQGLFLDDVAGMTLASQGHTATLLGTLDKRFRGVVTPLRFDTLDWWGNTNEAIGAVRLRQYQQSFKRYGAKAITKVEDAIAKATIQRKTWREMRGEVWGAVSKTVEGQQWMVDRVVRTELSAAYNGTTLAALHEENDPSDPMLKKLVATFDIRTGKDSKGVHGQTKKLDDRFFDAKLGIFYQAPPNRPHDRETVMGWRTSYGDAMADPYADKTRMSVQVPPKRAADAMMVEPPALLTKAVDPSLPEMTLTQAAKVIGLKRVTLHHAHLKGFLKTTVKIPAGKGKAVPMVTAADLEAFRAYHLDLKFGAGKKAAKVAKKAKPKPAPKLAPKPKVGEKVKVGPQTFEVKAKVGPSVVDTDKGLISIDGNAKKVGKVDAFDGEPKNIPAWSIEEGDYLAGFTGSKHDKWMRMRRVEKVEVLPDGMHRLTLDDGETFKFAKLEKPLVRKASVQKALEEKAAKLVTDPALIDLDLVDLPDFKTHAKLAEWMKVEHGVDFNLSTYDLALAKQIAQRVVSRSRRFSYMRAQTKIGKKKMKAGAQANRDERSIMFDASKKDHEAWGGTWDNDYAKPFGPKGAKVDTPFGVIKHLDRKDAAKVVADHEIGHHLQYGVWDAAREGDALAVLIRDEWTKLVVKHAAKPSGLASGLSRYASVGWRKSSHLGAELWAESMTAIWNGKGHLVHPEVRALLQKAMRMNPAAKAAKAKKLGDAVPKKAKVVPKPKPPAKPIEPKVPVAAKAEPADVLNLDVEAKGYSLNEAKKVAKVPYGSIQGAVKSGKLKSTKSPKLDKSGNPMFGKKTGEQLYEYTVDGEDLKSYAKAYHAKKGKTVTWGDAPEPTPKPTPKPAPVPKPEAPKPAPPKPEAPKPAPEMKPAYSLNEIKKEFDVPYGTIQGAVKSGKLKSKAIPKLKPDGTPKIGPKTGKPLYTYEVASEDLKPWLESYAKTNPKVKVPGGAPKPKPVVKPKPKPEAPKPKAKPKPKGDEPIMGEMKDLDVEPGDVLHFSKVIGTKKAKIVVKNITKVDGNHVFGDFILDGELMTEGTKLKINDGVRIKLFKSKSPKPKAKPKVPESTATVEVIPDAGVGFAQLKGPYSEIFNQVSKGDTVVWWHKKKMFHVDVVGTEDGGKALKGKILMEGEEHGSWIKVPSDVEATIQKKSGKAIKPLTKPEPPKPKPKPSTVSTPPPTPPTPTPVLKIQQATYTVAEAKKATGIPYGSVVSGIKSGKLKAIKVGGKDIVMKADLEAFAKMKAEAKAKKLAKAKPKTEVPEPKVSSDLPKPKDLIREKPIEASEWKNIGGQKGSNPGGTYQAANGEKWYVKTPQDKAKYAGSTGEELARNEVLAAKLYKAGGIEVAEVELAVREGKTSIASKIIDGLRSDAGLLKAAKKPEGVYDGFAMDAWLANWDVVGQGYDNLLIKGGKAIRVDTGGALRFRAQGGPKGGAFGDVVDEMDSLRSGPNPQANSVFKDMTDDDLVASIDKVLAVDDKTVRELVEAYGPKNDKERKVLSDRLLKRKEDLRGKRAKIIKEKAAKAKEAAEAKKRAAAAKKRVEEMIKSGKVPLRGKGWSRIPKDKQALVAEKYVQSMEAIAKKKSSALDNAFSSRSFLDNDEARRAAKVSRQIFESTHPRWMSEIFSHASSSWSGSSVGGSADIFHLCSMRFKLSDAGKVSIRGKTSGRLNVNGYDINFDTGEVRKGGERIGSIDDAFAAFYGHTQAMLEAKGVRKVRAYRGVNGDLATGLSDALAGSKKQHVVFSDPAASWSDSPMASRNFSQKIHTPRDGKRYAILTREADASEIIADRRASPYSIGLGQENEYILAGDNRRVEVYAPVDNLGDEHRKHGDHRGSYDAAVFEVSSVGDKADPKGAAERIKKSATPILPGSN